MGVEATMHVVSSCPHCGSPIYGPESVTPDEVPAIVRTCLCVPPLTLATPSTWETGRPWWSVPTPDRWEYWYGSGSCTWRDDGTVLMHLGDGLRA